MNIVHIVLEFPKPHGSGGDLRNRAIAASLSRHGRCTTISIQNALGIGERYPKRKPSFVEADLPPEVIRQIADDLARAAPDLIIVDGVFLADIARQLALDGHRVIIDMHNVESAVRQEIDQSKNNWTARLRYHKRWRAAEEAERQLARMASRVWVCSARDAATMRHLAGPGPSIAIVPNPIPEWCQKAAPLTMPAPWKARILFVGHLGYAPNVAAGKRLLRQIFPEIRKRMPDATLEICGRTPGKELVTMAGLTPGVTLTADPPELASHYRRASVALMPLTEGGGTRLKALEAMALGLPVVATAKAVEGLGVVPDHTFLLAETNAEFVGALQRLSAAPQLVLRLAGAGREFAFEHHGPKAIDRAVANGIAFDV